MPTFDNRAEPLVCNCVISMQFIDDSFIASAENDHQTSDDNSFVAMARSR